MSETITKLCKKYTDLTNAEIKIICRMEEMLQPLANLEDADIFIDCPCVGGEAVVVAEANPSDAASSYQKSVVGMLAKQENEPAVERTFRLGITTKHMKALTQENTHVVQSVEPIKYGNRIIGVLIREKRMDEQKDFVHSSYTMNNDFFSHMIDKEEWLTEYIDEGLLLVDGRGIVSFRNTFAKELYLQLGFIEDVLGQKYKNICLIQLEHEIFMETEVGKHQLSVRHIPLGRPDIDFAVIIRDVTWIEKQKKELVLKSVAIKEMHHRVKNNLQTIASLLNLQGRRTDNKETRKALTESTNRILSIAATHELLAQSGVDQVSITEVIANIKNNAVRSFLSPHFHAEITLEGDDFCVDSDIASTAALVINELLQNSLQYAFIGKERGTVQIIITKGSLYSTIEVIDDGTGFDVENRKTNRLGLSIVQALVKDKLHGTLEVKSSERGTKVTFDFLNQIIDVVTAPKQ